MSSRRPLTAGFVVVPLVVTAIVAAWLAREADEAGRKMLLMAAFAALLAQNILFAIDLGPWFLVGVQVLEDLAASVSGISTPLVIADVSQRSGRYNFSFGAAAMREVSAPRSASSPVDSSPGPSGSRPAFSDTLIGMGFSNVIALAIIVTAAATLNKAGANNVNMPRTPRRPWSRWRAIWQRLFCFGIAGTGLLAVPVLAGRGLTRSAKRCAGLLVWTAHRARPRPFML